MAKGANTVLNYTIVPNPVHIGGDPQELTIIATLKSNAEFGQPLSSATIEKIEINFGPATGDAISLTNKTNAITAADFSPNDNWKVTDGSTNVVEVQPTSGGSGQIINDAIVLTVPSVQVNDAIGSVAITFTETVSKINGNATIPPPLEKTNVASVSLSKIEEKASGKSTFTSNYYAIKSGGDVTLSWNIADNTAPVSLHYISNNKFVHTGKPTAGNPYPGITSHADGTSLQSKDHYPNQKYNDSPTALTLTDTTVFILKVGSDTYLTCTVIVEDANITAKSITTDSLTIGNSTTSPGAIDLKSSQGAWAIGTSTEDSNLHVKKKDDKEIIEISENQVNIGANPWPLATFNVSGSMSIKGSDGVANFYTQKGFHFTGYQGVAQANLANLDNHGNFDAYGNINAGGNIKAAGDIKAAGSIRSTKQYITASTKVEVGGWGGPQATWSNALAESSGGASISGSIGSIDGFSSTSGAGNVGYYMIDLGTYQTGLLNADFQIGKYSGTTGVGKWFVMTSERKIDNGKFSINSSQQVWSLQKDISIGNLYGILIEPINLTTYIGGQYIYFGAVDLNQGQLGIKMMGVTMTP